MAWSPPESDAVVPEVVSSGQWRPPDGDRVVGQGRSFLGVNRENLRQSISTAARPILEMTGAVAGGALGSPGGPLGVAAGGAGGYATGKAGADLVDRLLGVKKPLKSAAEAGKETASNLYEGAQNEASGLAIGKALDVAKKPIAKFIGNVGRAVSGVRPESGERLFKDPTAILSPSTKSVGAKLGKIRNELGMTLKPSVDEIVDSEASTARKTIKDIYEKFQAGQASGAELLKAAQSVDDVIEVTPMKQRAKRASLFGLKNQFTDALAQVAGPERAVAKQYSRSALANEFKKALPVTKQGDVSVMRTFGLGAFGGGAAVGLLNPKTILAVIAQSPVLTGLGISTVGGFYKAMENPIIRRAVISGIRRPSEKGLSEATKK